MQKTDYISLFIVSLFSIVVMFPFLKDLWSKEYKQMIDDMKGENRKWDTHEIWERYSLRFATGFYFSIILMVIMSTFSNVDYPVELYVLTFLGTFGSNGLAALLMFMKHKKQP